MFSILNWYGPHLTSLRSEHISIEKSLTVPLMPCTTTLYYLKKTMNAIRKAAAHMIIYVPFDMHKLYCILRVYKRIYHKKQFNRHIQRMRVVSCGHSAVGFYRLKQMCLLLYQKPTTSWSLNFGIDISISWVCWQMKWNLTSFHNEILNFLATEKLYFLSVPEMVSCIVLIINQCVTRRK